MQYARKPFFLYQFMNRVGILSTFAKSKNENNYGEKIRKTAMYCQIARYSY